MNNFLEIILSDIKKKNLKHAIKLEENLVDLGEDYKHAANDFFAKYELYLKRNKKTFNFGVDCYLKLLQDTILEKFKFIRSGKYSNSSFDEVTKSIYGNSEIMTYHMHGLVLAQFLWFDQYERISFFTQNIKKHIPKKNKYLEIGGGHGLYMNEAIKLIPEMAQFDLVDISQSSLDLAKGIIDNDKVNYYLKNIFDYYSDERYDFITMGEVLEHLEDPLSILKKIKEFLTDDGVCFLSTPINCPMIDHIYLFNNEREIRELFTLAGLEVIEEKIVITEKITREEASRYKVPVMYAAFIKKIKCESLKSNS
jgi:2-polyprenyl-3-methyl-5-hydroxy-6-metoxy-1,4-benzoquinol methylase